MATMASTSRPPSAGSSSTATRLKRTSGWFSSAKANLKAIATSSAAGGGGGGGVDSVSPASTADAKSALPTPTLKRNGSLRASFGSSRAQGEPKSNPTGTGALSIKTTNLDKPTGLPRAIQEEPAVAPVEKRIIGAVQDEWPLYSCRSQDYTILEPIGFGSSSVVHLANYSPVSSASSTSSPLRCAVKIIDVDRLSSVGDIDRLRRETQLMALSKHPNVLRVRGEWIQDSRLFIAVRYMTHGSLLDISRYAFPDGFDENVIATVLQQALHGLVYLHQNGWLHRDIKAANLLVDDDGTVLLADFGVSSSLFQEAGPGPRTTTTTKTAAASLTQPRSKNTATASSDEDEVERAARAERKAADEDEDDATSPFAARKSFVGTPSWMAPEVIERKRYDAKADMWSFGITALELASGRAPNSLYPPAKALSKTILDDPPELDRDGGKYKYSKAFKEMVDTCLQKDPKKRPTAEKLLQHAFFRNAKKKSYLVSAILDDLPPVQDRQQRRRKNSHDRADTMTSGWDFNPTQPSTPLSARHPSSSDPFASFSTTNSPYNTLPSRSLSNLPSPTRAALPSMFHHQPSPSTQSSSSMSQAGPRRSRDPSMRNSHSNHHHHRNVSFDFDVPGAPAPTSAAAATASNPSTGSGFVLNSPSTMMATTTTGGTMSSRDSRRARDASVASVGGRGSVHFADRQDDDDDRDDAVDRDGKDDSDTLGRAVESERADE